ncbi:MAG TPA: hypothetical protein VN729_13135 [Ktedonobacteraceae bacterium]|nr:hypothetical protein [Ktedonobacteraceae bacterium]
MVFDDAVSIWLNTRGDDCIVERRKAPAQTCAGPVGRFRRYYNTRAINVYSGEQVGKLVQPSIAEENG